MDGVKSANGTRNETRTRVLKRKWFRQLKVELRIDWPSVWGPPNGFRAAVRILRRLRNRTAELALFQLTDERELSLLDHGFIQLKKMSPRQSANRT